MKTYNSLLYLFALVFTLALTSCSDDSDNNTDNPEATNLLIGEWLLISEGTYFCGTEDVNTPDLADLDDIFEFNEDGTWGAYINNETEYSIHGTWEFISGDNYSIYWTEDNITETTTIEFEDNNTMKFGISDCWEITNGDSIYSYDVLERQ